MHLLEGGGAGLAWVAVLFGSLHLLAHAPSETADGSVSPPTSPRRYATCVQPTYIAHQFHGHQTTTLSFQGVGARACGLFYRNLHHAFRLSYMPSYLLYL